MTDEADYLPVTAAAEKTEVFSDLLVRKPPVMGLAADNVVFRLKPLRLENGLLYFELEEGSRSLFASEALALVFGLPSGQFILRGKMALKATNLYAIPTAGDLRRMQRRSSFRATVTSTYPLVFHAQPFSGSPKAFTFQVLDVSAGGLGLYVPAGVNSPVVQAGIKLKGALKFPDRDDLPLSGEVRHIFPPDNKGGYKAGFELQDLTPTDQQELFVISLKIHRQIAGNFLR